MGRPVLADKSGTVQAYHDRKVLKRNVVDNLVVCPLGEGRVDVAERPHSSGGESCGKGHGMLLCNADIEEPVRHLFRQKVHPATGRHGWSNAYNLRIMFGQIEKRLSEHVLIAADAVSGRNSLACLRVENAGCMPDGLLLLRRSIPLSFFGYYMQDARSPEVTDFLERRDHLSDVVAVNRSEVAEAESLEDVTTGTLYNRMLGIGRHVFQSFAEAILPYRVPDVCLDAVVGRVCRKTQQVLVHGTEVSINREIVVVDYHEQIRLAGSCVVHPFVGKSSSQCAIAYDSHNLLVPSFHTGSCSKSESRGNGS